MFRTAVCCVCVCVCVLWACKAHVSHSKNTQVEVLGCNLLWTEQLVVHHMAYRINYGTQFTAWTLKERDALVDASITLTL